MSDTAPVIPGMKHAGWHCKHDPFTPGDEHTEWAPRRKHDGWKRKKRPGVISSITPADNWGGRPDEPGCLKARPLYEPAEEREQVYTSTCAQVSRGGYNCTLPSGHEGRHEAHGTGCAYEVWEDR